MSVAERLRNEIQLTKKKVDAPTSLFIEEWTVHLKSDNENMDSLIIRAKMMYDDISGRLKAI